MSLQIGEWWQGMKYRGYYDDGTARAYHFSGVRQRYDPALFGWFDVTTRDGAGAEQRPPLYDGGHSVTWINPGYSQWQLWGGGGFAMPCLGTSMVQMHGVDGGGRDKVWPPTPVGADGGECWSNARPLVLRANSEGALRAEPGGALPVHRAVLGHVRCGSRAADSFSSLGSRRFVHAALPAGLQPRRT